MIGGIFGKELGVVDRLEGNSADDGAVSVIVVVLAALVVGCVGFVLAAGVLAAGQSRADGLADRAALAAADAASGRLPGWEPCLAAAQAITHSSATVVECLTHDQRIPAGTSESPQLSGVGGHTAQVSVLVDYRQKTPWGQWNHRSWATAG